MKFSVLASGSKGNALYVETEQTKLLVDAGISCRELIRRLHSIEVETDNLDALVITHEHSDHIRGAGPISRHFDIPVYINGPTFNKSLKYLGKISRPVTIQTGQAIPINDILIETFTKCHDAADPIGLTISSNGSKLGILTDAGRSTMMIEEKLAGCQTLIIEFNHDSVMLDQSLYPLSLKRRIKGPEGHLSNEQAGDLLKAVSGSSLTRVVLAHLSDKNNLPDKAYQEASSVLADCGMNDVEIVLTRQDEPIQLIDLG